MIFFPPSLTLKHKLRGQINCYSSGAEEERGGTGVNLERGRTSLHPETPLLTLQHVNRKKKKALHVNCEKVSRNLLKIKKEQAEEEKQEQEEEAGCNVCTESLQLDGELLISQQKNAWRDGGVISALRSILVDWNLASRANC